MSDALSKRLTQALGSSFTVEGEIGRGGMGVVYNARDERLKRKVAIKVLPPELAFREEIRIRFLREAETAARLSHPHIVPIHSVGEGPEGLVYFVMAYVDGESLGARIKRRGKLPPEEARRILMETADALGAGHALGIVHRDVKPDNILLEGSRGRVVLTDFGIAKALTSTTGPGTLTATGVAIGTPHYMSPEQAAGDREIDGRSDIYSLGVVGYQMLTDELPFSAPTVPGLLLKQITEQAPYLKDKAPACPDDLAGCVMRSLEKDPEARWPTADALRRALESRSTPAYRPRRSAGTRFGPLAWDARDEGGGEGAGGEAVDPEPSCRDGADPIHRWRAAAALAPPRTRSPSSPRAASRGSWRGCGTASSPGPRSAAG
jgi:serine/threonine-protein kinase